MNNIIFKTHDYTAITATIPVNADTGVFNSGRIKIDADQIDVDGIPLNTLMAQLQEQLMLLRPALKLHSEYMELGDIYHQYCAKLDEIREKQKMWDTLKK